MSAPPYSKYDVVVVGGGVVGCAVAYRLAPLGLRVALLEREARLAAGITCLSSGILHSPLAYGLSDFQVQACLSGAVQTREYCQKRGVPHHVPGKLLVARSKSELPSLEALYRSCLELDIPKAKLLSGNSIQGVEANVRGLAALYLPQETVVDPLALSEALADDAVRQGAKIQLGVDVVGVEETSGEVQLRTNRGVMRAQLMVNAAGASALGIAHRCGLARGVRAARFTGVLYHTRANLVDHVVHPVPVAGLPFLHARVEPLATGVTRIGPRASLGGQGLKGCFPLYRLVSQPRFWRIVLGQLREAVSVNAFLRSVQGTVPGVARDSLLDPRIAFRPQLASRGKPLDDFMVVKSKASIHVLNTVSPALTCCLPLADRVVSAISRPWVMTSVA